MDAEKFSEYFDNAPVFYGGLVILISIETLLRIYP